MKHAQIPAAVFAALALSAAGLAMAQPAENRRVQAQVDRLMANDRNGDGKLSRDELPARLADRLFAEADTDGDGLLTREDVTAHVMGARPAGEDATPAQTAQPGASPESGHQAFEGAMKQAGGSMRALRRSQFAPATRDSDLDAAQSMQEAMIAAKASFGSVAMSAAARARFRDDQDAYRRAFRLAIIESLRAAIDLEQAVLEEDQPKAQDAQARLMATQKSAHDLFQDE